MAIVTRAEFAAICNRTVLIINTNVSRRKISSLSNKTIDTDNPLNVIYKKKCQKEDKEALEGKRAEKREARKPKEAPALVEEIKKTYDAVVQKVEPVEEIFTKKETASQKKEREKQNKNDQEYIDWDARKKKADALKAERQAELSQLQVEKMMGNLMPVDLVESILKINIQDIFKTFEIELINLASIYCDILAGGDRNKLAEIVVKLRQKLNETIKRIESNAAQEIEGVVEDYAEVRNRGERK